MNKDNSILINPNGKLPAYDNIFFHQGSPYNQGNIFDWDENEFISGMEQAEKRFKDNPENIEGIKLQDEFTYKKMVDSILDILSSI
jgi:hypothetical protein